MPSPLNGLIEPAASPTTIHVGPTFGLIEPPIGRRPPVGGAIGDSGSICQCSGSVCAHSVMRWLVFTDLKSRNVDSSPMPTLIEPLPTGKIQPYPGSDAPLRSRTSRADSI